MSGLDGKVALVTGASRGIGRAVAIQLAANGARVGVNYHTNAEFAEQVVQEITAAGGQALAIQADVSNPDDVERMITVVRAEFSGLDILVNNAGITRDGLLMRMSEDDWDAVLDTNLKGPFLCTRVALRIMLRQRGGRIVNISSVSGVLGNAGQANYSAAKAGLIGFTKAVAREAASRGVTVNAVAPGFIETDMVQTVPEKLREGLLQQIPLGRFGQVEDVAAVVAFLASEEAGYVTGQVFGVDGGLGM